MLRGGDVRLSKSWGNGYFRFNLLDLIKIVMFVSGIVSVVVAIKYEVKDTKRIAIESKEDIHGVRQDIKELREEVKTLTGNVITKEDMKRIEKSGNKIHQEMWDWMKNPKAYRDIE